MEENEAPETRSTRKRFLKAARAIARGGRRGCGSARLPGPGDQQLLQELRRLWIVWGRQLLLLLRLLAGRRHVVLLDCPGRVP